MENLKGKTAFITGGASGIGLAIAKSCAAEGMNIVIADLRQSAIDEALPLFRENNWPAVGVQLNVTDREGFEKAADEAEAAFGNIHLLVNNAGIGGAHAPLWEVSYKETDLAIDINIVGVLNGIKAIVPRMLKHGEESHIVSTSSKAALIAVPNNGLYNLAKQAVIGITESLATDLQDTKIGCSVFCPGPFKSSLGTTSGEVTAQLIGDVPPEQPRFAKEGEEVPPFVKRMRELERPAEEAGKRVVRGIKRNDLYILTHTEFIKGYKSRIDAMFRAFPNEEPNEEFYQLYSFLTQNPIFDKQTDVPAFEG